MMCIQANAWHLTSVSRCLWNSLHWSDYHSRMWGWRAKVNCKQLSSGRAPDGHFSSRRASLVAQTVKRPPATQETQVRSLGQEDPLERGMATHSSILG